MASDTAANNLQRLNELGQSVWFDYIRRGLLESGEFAAMVRSGWILSGSHDYDAALDRLRSEGVRDPYEAFLVLAVDDLRAAADELRQIYDPADGRDGFVSFEAQEGPPGAMVAEARRAFGLLDRPNVMIKVPGTNAGIDAVRILIADGINVNITLLFDVEVYQKVALAYIDGLEERRRRGLSLQRVASVASFFVSRVDTKAETILPDTSPLRGRIAVANARLAYKRFQEIFSGPRWQSLADAGARVQQPLWASTGTKNPAYSDTLYVEELIAPDTVNTMPEATLRAFLDHGMPRLSLEAGIAEAADVRRQAVEAKIDLQQVGRELLAEGLDSFRRDFSRLLDEIGKKLASGIDVSPTPRAASALSDRVDARLKVLAESRIMERIWACDHTVWKPDPTEISKPSRLGWLTVVDLMLEQAPALRKFAREAADDGFTTCLLCGMGGSSLAAATMAATFAAEPRALHVKVLDTTDPDAIADLERSLHTARTLFLIASKSGTTLETRSHLEYFWQKAPHGRQFVAITDKGTELESLARERGFRKVFLNPADIGGRCSALSYFGLVPAPLMGVDIERLLDSAHEMMHACHYCLPPHQNPAARLGAYLGEAALAGRDKLTLLLPDEIATLGDWIEQLIAESTGKEGRGIVPIAGEAKGLLEVYGSDRLFVAIGDPDMSDLEAAGHPVVELPFEDPYRLGGQFFLWELATAVAGHVLGVNPFDQPNVEEAKTATGRLLAGGGPRRLSPHPPALPRLRELVQERDYVALQAYVAPSPETDVALNRVRLRLRDRLGVATTVGYGPRFLHSTGQLHKGGPGSGVFIQVVSRNETDLEIPNAQFTFGDLKRAQAQGDWQSLLERGRRVVLLETGSRPALELERLVEQIL